AALVERLAAVVPSPVSLVAVGSDIEVSAGQGRYGQVTMDLSAFGPLRGHITENEFLRAACCHVLDAVQDYVAEATTEPWPGTREMPEPVVEVSADAIKLAYQ